MSLPESVRALHITGPDHFEIIEKPLPEVPSGMVLAAPAYVGLCGTDLDLFDGSMPYLHQGFAEYPLQPGHEWSGRLLGPTAELPAGTRVILDPIISCGRPGCELCGNGLAVRCSARLELGVRNGLDGAMASVVAVPSDYLLPIPDEVSTRDAALVEPMVTTLEGIRRTDPQPGEEVLIVGAGTLGLAGAMILSARGIRTHVLLRSEVRAATVEAAGAIPWLAGTRAVVDKFDVVIEAAGTPGGVQASLAHAAPGGRVALLGVPTTAVEIDAGAIAVNDITIKGVLNGPGQYPSGLAAIESGVVNADLLVDRVYPFDESEAALARSKEPGRARPKVLVHVSEAGGEALEAGDPAAARAAMDAHMDQAADVLRQAVLKDPRVSILAIDIGSSRIKALLASWDGHSIAVRSASTPRQTTEPGEQSYPVDVVYSTIEGLISGLMDSYPSDRADTIVFSCLGTAMAPLGADGRPLAAALAPNDTRPMLGPGLDRTVDMEASELFRRTGSDPTVASFLQHALWWQREHPEVEERVDRFRSLRGYAVQELCGADAEDRSWASRTMLVDLETDGWSDEILAAADLPVDVLPPIEAPTTMYEVRGSVIERLRLAPGAVAVLGGMDNGCSLFGADGPGRSGVANIVGTYEHMAGAAGLAEVRRVAMATDAIVHAYVLPGRYITMTRVPMGALLAGLAEGDPRGLDEMMRAISDRPMGGVITLEPDAVAAALAGGRPRTWVLQSLIETGAGVLKRFADAWDELGLSSSPVAAVGGGAAQDAVLRLKADLLCRPFVTLQNDQAAGLGALRLGAMSRRGISASDACALFPNPITRTIQPRAITSTT